jgi:ligand-binding sensor domain-containing protein/signal transduction histidine kinase
VPTSKIFIPFFLFVFYATGGLAQRFHFEQIDIEDGLAQSQVTSITQDSKRRLWIATLGGISAYTGVEFTTFAKTDGLNSNFTLCLSADQKNNLWIGTARGLSRYDGQKFHNYKNAGAWCSQVITDKRSDTYAIIYRKLLKVGNSGATTILLTKDKKEKVTTLNIDDDGHLWAAVYGKGIYRLKDGQWKKYTTDITSGAIVTTILKDRFVKDKLWLLTEQGLYTCLSGKTTKANYAISGKLMAIAQDQDHNIWLGTNNGAYRISTDSTLIHFNKANGLTDNQVNEIFIDIENNIWFGTDGSGIFKYNKHSYETFDESQGLRNDIVMSLTKGIKADEIWLGTYNGLFSYHNGILREIVIPSNNHDSKKINVLFKDHKGQIWIGTPGGGLWLHNGKQIKKIDKENDLAYNAIMEDSQHRIWVSTNAGNFLVEQEQKKFIRITELFTSSLLELSRDSVIIGTQEGAYLIDKLKYVKLINIKKLAESSVLSMIKYKHFVFFGTADNGLMIWNRSTGEIINLTTKNGLAADHIYSLLADKDGIVWIGTGKGINRLDAKSLHVLKPAQLSLMVECNQNAILQSDNKIWIGTTKGAIVYDQKPQSLQIKKPYIYLTGVNIFSKERQSAAESAGVYYNEQQLTKIPALPFNKNNLNINFTAVYLTNPKAVSYKYRLLGLESKYSQPSSNTSINYTALPAGKYTFEVKALTESGTESINTGRFSFEIIPPYYQTNLFRIAAIAFIIFALLLTVYGIIQLNERKRKFRLRIKLEEQFKIRKQTAEDFHDDLGNKLTRISVLSDVLLSMVDEEDKTKRNIIYKINNNVKELYTGTKDILWALNPKNDNLSDLLNHIRDFGKELFNDTEIKFSHHIGSDIKDTRLSLQISRNILMIFKEALHNCLKHSKAKHVNFSATANDELLEIKVQDDGSGFDTEYEQNGHGINNMNVRAKRIDAYFITDSNSNGTTVNLYIKLSALNNFRNV